MANCHVIAYQLTCYRREERRELVPAIKPTHRRLLWCDGIAAAAPNANASALEIMGALQSLDFLEDQVLRVCIKRGRRSEEFKQDAANRPQVAGGRCRLILQYLHVHHACSSVRI
jgi:hypothetical protein